MSDNISYLDIPGPKSRELMARRQEFVARGVSSTMNVFAAKADGAIIEDVDGNQYIDFAGGIGVMNIGHTRPEVTPAIADRDSSRITKWFGLTMPTWSVALTSNALGILQPWARALTHVKATTFGSSILPMVRRTRGGRGRD